MSYLSQSAVLRTGLSKRAQAALLVRLDGKPISQVYMAQRKYDGVSGIVHTNGSATTRVGTALTTVDHIIAQCQRAFGENSVVFGEFWMPKEEQATINGKVMRIAPSPELKFVVFDVITHDEWFAGHAAATYLDRWLDYSTTLNKAYRHTASLIPAATYNPGTYGDEQQFCRDLLNNESGYDGIVLRDPDSQWLPGKDAFGYVIKVKQVLEFDLEVIGVEYGKGRNEGRVGAVMCRFRAGKTLRVSGMSDAERDAWAADPTLILGKIIEVHAVALSSNGLLREPRYKGIRHDKLTADY